VRYATPVLAAALLAPAGCGSDPAPAAPAAPEMVTVTVGATGVSRVTYTDPAAPGGVGSRDTSPLDITYIPVTVPRGSTVTVNVAAAPGSASGMCTISDASKQLTYAKGATTCEAVAP
jgi:hypothetical protein